MCVRGTERRAWLSARFPTPQYVGEPMDLGSIKVKLKDKKYTDPREFASDVRLVWNNCRTYNQANSTVRVWGDQLSDDFERKWTESGLEAKWDDLVASRDPPVSAGPSHLT
jgi:hypothetical protein